MRELHRKLSKYMKYFGWAGFLGFLGFSYFISYEPAMLTGFGFFAFFSFFFFGKLEQEIPDERYEENNIKARSKAMAVPMMALFLIWWGAGYPFGTKEFMIAVSALGYAATFITYSGLFYYYETH